MKINTPTQTDVTGTKRPSVVFSLVNNTDTIIEVQGVIFNLKRKKIDAFRKICRLCFFWLQKKP